MNPQEQDNQRPFPILTAWVLLMIVLALAFAFAFTGCALNRPLVRETTTGTNGLVNERVMKATTLALWPATTEVAKQRLSAGKTLGIGSEGISETAGATTNDVQILNALRAILGK